ncbi:hypothetical protein Glove_372g109 [Diversispora epigaea]|uniref:Uncharacterized protein n=1 Tax=Diversispora epigaea TaxID=1348612 RepID=A0A397HE73_9GLOM|nr:hypothetical protein Glove_372g111 [Diversispora epigaea]RHZ58670.1 hypothetical protein Glove_372g109 [Diversispora epigaea]
MSAMISSRIGNHQKLIFQLPLSKDGFSPRIFWDICHGHANTILVDKVEGADKRGPYLEIKEFMMKSDASNFIPYFR